MSWIERILNPINSEKKASIPDGVWTKCPNCEEILYRPELEANLNVCPKCQYHMRLSARKRLISFLDSGTSKELTKDLKPKDILKFKDSKKYKDRLSVAQRETHE